MLRPVIMIGCGGSGQKAVRYVRDAVKRRLLHAGWDGDFPESWQFLGIDTLSNQEDPSIPFLPANDYISVSLNYATYTNLAAALDAKFPQGSAGFKEMRGWRPKPNEVTVPLQDGAGQLRAVGRAAGILALKNVVQPRLKNAFSACASGGPVLAEVSQRLGVTVPPGTPVPEPLTIVVGSMAGGTGAGIMLDVVDLLRRTHVDGAFPVMVAFTPDIFGSHASDQMTANSAAFVSEFLSAYWDDEGTDSALVPPLVQVGTRGPHSTFMVGRRNMDGLDLGNAKNVYRAVGEALAAVTTSGKVQQTFRNFITTNWANAAPTNGGGFGWHNDLLKGALSSFGSTTLSIGRDRFSEYLSRLLHRSLVEFLSDGYNQIAHGLLGEEVSKGMAGHSKIAELSRLHRDEFMLACQLMEKGSYQQISNTFVSSKHLSEEFQQVSNTIKQGFLSVSEQPANVWLQQIKARHQEAKVASQNRAQNEISIALKEWSSELFETVLTTCTEFSARLSFPVVISLLERARADLMESSALIKEKAKDDSNKAFQINQQVPTHLSLNSKGGLSINSNAVQLTIKGYAEATSYEWSARVREQLAVALESVSSGMLNAIQSGLQQSLNRLGTLITSQDGKAPVVSFWPKNDGVVPEAFAPSPVEFYLEDHAEWPETARGLLGKSLGEDRDRLPLDEIDAARTLLIHGGFNKGKDDVFNPLVWSKSSSGGRPKWIAGQPVVVQVPDGLEEIQERIEAWIKKPSTEIARFLNEGLSDYLSEVVDKVVVTNHTSRLAMYKQKLQEALNQSRPLMEIDQNIYATVHDAPLVTSLNVQGFPFGVGHPARDITLAVVQGFLKNADSDLDIFTSGETESVLISSFLDNPVNPSVVASFTQPMTQSMSNVPPDKLKASFWLWRRARILENFIPLPDHLRLAAIRGFAIARALGYCTATAKEGNLIVNSDGIHEFPKHLLTVTDANNILPALLEAMILTFAEAPTKGKAAFSAYGALISYGMGGGLVDKYELPTELISFLNDNEYVYDVVDSSRRDKTTANDFLQRKENVLKFLDGYLSNLKRLDAQPQLKTYWRDKSGAVDPTDTLLLELMTDLTRGFTEVRTAVHNHSQEDSETWS